MHRRASFLGRLAASLFAALAFLAADFSTAAPGEPVHAQGLARVRQGVLGVVPEAGFFIAIDQGYFREQGIELDLTQFDSAARMVPRSARGSSTWGTARTARACSTRWRAGSASRSWPTPP